MIRIFQSTAAVLLGLSLFSSCGSLPPPFSTPYQAERGFKSRTFVGTPKDVRPAVIATLQGMGYEVHESSEGKSFLSANRGMGASNPEVVGGMREWTRVKVQVKHVDKHRRAPRTLVVVDAENINGTSGGPIEAGFGSVSSDFYETFFGAVSQRVDAARPRPMARGFVVPRTGPTRRVTDQGRGGGQPRR